MSESEGASAPATPVMSYSRMNSILTCGEQFRLQRKVRVPQREHWASIGGSAFHAVVEKILLAEHKQYGSAESKEEIA